MSPRTALDDQHGYPELRIENNLDVHEDESLAAHPTPHRNPPRHFSSLEPQALRSPAQTFERIPVRNSSGNLDEIRERSSTDESLDTFQMSPGSSPPPVYYRLLVMDPEDATNPAVGNSVAHPSRTEALRRMFRPIVGGDLQSEHEVSGFTSRGSETETDIITDPNNRQTTSSKEVVDGQHNIIEPASPGTPPPPICFRLFFDDIHDDLETGDSSQLRHASSSGIISGPRSPVLNNDDDSEVFVLELGDEIQHENSETFDQRMAQEANRG